MPSRHIAWLTSCRFQLRRPKPWEHGELQNHFSPALEISDNYAETLEGELKKYLSQTEIDELMKGSNVATQIL